LFGAGECPNQERKGISLAQEGTTVAVVAKATKSAENQIAQSAVEKNRNPPKAVYIKSAQSTKENKSNKSLPVPLHFPAFPTVAWYCVLYLGLVFVPVSSRHNRTSKMLCFSSALPLFLVTQKRNVNWLIGFLGTSETTTGWSDNMTRQEAVSFLRLPLLPVAGKALIDCLLDSAWVY
jgi:hypothetical protein